MSDRSLPSLTILIPELSTRRPHEWTGSDLIVLYDFAGVYDPIGVNVCSK
jgi:hypothetical protein